MIRHLGLIATFLIGTTQIAYAQSSRPMTESELRTTQMSETWRNGQNLVTMGPDGKVVFVYGQAQPTIVCATLRLCDLELQPGEELMNVHVGDPVRWKFDGARSGPGGNTPHILIKPVEANIETSLVITTDRRVYHMHLKSSSTRYMARMAFDYTNEPMNMSVIIGSTKPDPVPEPIVMEAAPIVAPEPVMIATKPGFMSVDDLSYDYKVSGKARWKPVRVFNDGSKTYIEMPDKMRQTEAPVLLVIGADNNENVVNYRIRDGRYIVDQVFEEAIMQAGVGRNKERIKIEYQGA